MRKEEKSDATVRARCAGREVLRDTALAPAPLSAEEAAVAKNLAASPSLPEPETSNRPEE